MADIITTIALDDRQFKQGLQRTETFTRGVAGKLKSSLGGENGLGGLIGFGGAAGFVGAATAIQYRTVTNILSGAAGLVSEYGKRWEFAREQMKQATTGVDALANSVGRIGFAGSSAAAGALGGVATALNQILNVAVQTGAVDEILGKVGINMNLRAAYASALEQENIQREKQQAEAKKKDDQLRIVGAYGVSAARALGIIGGYGTPTAANAAVVSAEATDAARKRMQDLVAEFQLSGGSAFNDQDVAVSMARRGVSQSDIEFARRAGQELRDKVSTTNDILRRIETKVGGAARYGR